MIAISSTALAVFLVAAVFVGAVLATLFRHVIRTHSGRSLPRSSNRGFHVLGDEPETYRSNGAALEDGGAHAQCARLHEAGRHVVRSKLKAFDVAFIDSVKPENGRAVFVRAEYLEQLNRDFRDLRRWLDGDPRENYWSDLCQTRLQQISAALAVEASKPTRPVADPFSFTQEGGPQPLLIVGGSSLLARCEKISRDLEERKK